MNWESSPASAANAGTGQVQTTIDKVSIGDTGAAHKRNRVLKALLCGPLTTFQAEKAPVFDHCLPSTISELRKSGFHISTRIITVTGYAGLPARIAEYTIADESRQRAAQWIGVTP